MNLLKTAFNVAMFVFGLAVVFTIFQLAFSYVEGMESKKLSKRMTMKIWKMKKGDKQAYKGGKIELVGANKLSDVEKLQLAKMTAETMSTSDWNKLKRNNPLKKAWARISRKLSWIGVTNDKPSLDKMKVLKPKGMSNKDWRRSPGKDEEGKPRLSKEATANQYSNKKTILSKAKFPFMTGLKKTMSKEERTMDLQQWNKENQHKIIKQVVSMAAVKGVDETKCPIDKPMNNIVYEDTGKLDKKGRKLCDGEPVKVSDMTDGVDYYLARIARKRCNPECLYNP